MKTFSLSLKLKGFPIDKAKLELADISRISEKDYPDFITKQREKIVNYHLENNPFYQSKVIGRFSTWEDLPIMKKEDYQIPLAKRLSNDFTEKNVYINKTSGSSGHPIRFAKDKYSHAITWASLLERFKQHGIDFDTSFQARYYGISLDKREYYSIRFKDFLANRYRFSINDLSESALQKMLEVYRNKPFTYINGYTSSIVLFAKFLRSKNIILKDVCPTLKVCIVTSEMLFEDDKALLAKHLGVPVINEYGCSEAGVLAFTNCNDVWEVDSKTLFVEILDEDDRPVSKGTEGKIIVTSLHNKAHPFIRYEVGDYGALSKNGTAKKPILQKLLGRTNDFALLPSGKKSAGMTFYVITKKIMEESGNIKEFKIIQSQMDTFEINYVSEEELSNEKKNAISKVFDQFLEPGLTYNFHKKPQLDRTSSGKLKQFVSLVNSPK